jgi:two-component system, chemotaxis family, response regulator Rcp1
MSGLVILLVEDNVADVVFFREAIADAGVRARLEVVGNGEDAMRFLYRQEPFDHAPHPDVVVLDLNVPIKNGREVLVEMASDPALNTIPVAILTTSTSETCVCDLYPPGRCVYFVKTDEFGQLQEIVRQIAAHAGAA